MSDKIYLGESLSGLDIGEKPSKISRVNLLVDGQTMYTAGDDTGRTIEKTVPWATQQMANDVLQMLRDVDYQPFYGTNALIDPAAEIGDSIEVGGINSILAKKNTNYGRMSISDIAAPGSDEIDDEYPYISKAKRLENRKLAQTYSYIKKTSEEILLGVANDLEKLKAEIDITLDQIRIYVDNGDAQTRGEIDVRADEILAQVTDDLNGMRSLIDIKLGEISLEVTESTDEHGQTTARITLKVGPNSYSGYIKIDGNLDVSGQLSADALYAALGDIADLTVNRLSTSRRIVKYLAKDMSDDNYVNIEGEKIDLITGTTDGSDEQAVTPNGGLIYWEADVSEADLGTNGYPYINGERIFTTTTETPWPVMVYVYSEQVKRSINFEKDGNGIYTPVDTFGAGLGEDYPVKSQGYIQKKTNSFDMWLHTREDEDHGIFIGEEYTDIVGLRKTSGLNFSEWDSGRFVERVDGDDSQHVYEVTFDDQKRPTSITDGSGHVCYITW